MQSRTQTLKLKAHVGLLAGIIRVVLYINRLCPSPTRHCCWTHAGIILSHWGRTDFPHTSNTQYGSDNYTREVHHSEFPGGWLSHSVNTHPCFDPKKVRRGITIKSCLGRSIAQRISAPWGSPSCAPPHTHSILPTLPLSIS